jgi:hypothetical protein
MSVKKISHATAIVTGIALALTLSASSSVNLADTNKGQPVVVAGPPACC